MNVIPASPGTYLLERRQGQNNASKTPVVGYAFVQIGPVYPLCLIHHDGLTRGRVLVTPDNFVTDPSYGIVCGSVEEWMTLSSTAAYWTAKEQLPVQTPGKAPPEAEDDTSVSDAPRSFRERPAPAPAAETGISFGTKTFKTNSFWKAAIDDVVSLFQIAGETPYPNDKRCEKITREEYTALKRAGSGVIDAALYASSSGAESDEDDDGMDLV